MRGYEYILHAYLSAVPRLRRLLILLMNDSL